MTRVYVPTTPRRLRAALRAGSVSTAVPAHAVTAAVRAALPDEGEEEWEHAVAEVAAQRSVALLEPDESPRRMVLALEVPEPSEVAVEGDDPTAVAIGDDVPLQRLAAVMSDGPDAEPAVAAARAAATGSGEAETALDRCLDHGLGWWAVQELDQLLDSLS